MISLCTVVLNGMEPMTETLLESVVNNTKYITQVLVAHVEKDTPYHKLEYLRTGLTVIHFGHPLDQYANLSAITGQAIKTYGHALGLHACIDMADQPIVLMSDPDTFYYPGADEIYLGYMEFYNLHFIGIEHFDPYAAQGKFPVVTSFMSHKKNLPPTDWVVYTTETGITAPAGQKRAYLPGKYLLQGPIDGEPEGFHYDVGIGLFRWSEEIKGRWLSFAQRISWGNGLQYNSGMFTTSFGVEGMEVGKPICFHLLRAGSPYIVDARSAKRPSGARETASSPLG
jgi:hypothetical protein